MVLLNKTIKRELPCTYDRKFWIVELHPFGLVFRAKRTRRTFPILWEQVWNRAMMIAAEQARKERLEKRKAKKAGRA